MKRLFLHIGRHKTGTTSIQKTLHQNREKLIEYGFYYPETGIRVVAHHNIAEALGGGRGLPISEVVRDELLLKLRNEVEETNCKNIIISSEGLQGCKPADVFSFFEDFDVIPVCYLREQAAYLRSSYLQKVHATNYLAPIESFYRESFSADYRLYLIKWKAVFTKDFHIRLFEKSSLTDGDVVRDFLFAILGLSREQIESLEVLNDENPSLSREMLSFKYEYNSRDLPNNGKTYFGLGKLSKEYGSKYEIPLALTQEIRAQYSDSNKWVEENLLTDGQRFSYPPFDGKPLARTSEEDFDAIFDGLLTMKKNTEKERIRKPRRMDAAINAFRRLMRLH